MKKSFFRSLGITVGGALAIVAGISIFNKCLFTYIPHLNRLILPNEALFLDGLLMLALGILILFKLPRARVIGGRGKLLIGSGGFSTNTESHEDATRNIQVVGFALVMASAILCLLYFSGTPLS